MGYLKPLATQIEELRWKIHQAEQNNNPMEAARLSMECIEKEKRLKEHEHEISHDIRSKRF